MSKLDEKEFFLLQELLPTFLASLVLIFIEIHMKYYLWTISLRNDESKYLEIFSAIIGPMDFTFLYVTNQKRTVKGSWLKFRLEIVKLIKRVNFRKF